MKNLEAGQQNLCAPAERKPAILWLGPVDSVPQSSPKYSYISTQSLMKDLFDLPRKIS